MTSQGSEYTTFARALRTGDLEVVLPALAALPNVGLDDALAVLVLMARAEDERFERAAARFCGRVASERRLSLDEHRRLLALAEVMPAAPDAVAAQLAGYCRVQLRGA